MVARRPLVQVSGLVREMPDGDTFAPSTATVTRTLPYTNGGMGGTVPTAIAAATAGSARWVIKLPLDVTQWRLKLRNWDANETAKTAATLKKLIIGKHDLPLTGTALETGSYQSSTATTVVSTDQTIPGSATWYTSPWVTASGDIFTANTEFLIGIGWTFASSTALSTSAGKAWRWTNSTSATDPTVAGSGGTVGYIPFDWIVEYTSTSRRKVCLVVGDSIVEPISGDNTGLSPTSLWRGAVHLWAAATNRLIVNISLNGIAAGTYALDPASNTYPHYIYNRQGLDTITFDEILYTLGSNDVNAGQTLAQMQASALAVLSRLRTSYGITTAPMYMATVLPRGSTGDTVRTGYNAWLSQVPSIASGVVDFSGLLRGTTSTSMWPEYTPDSIHPSWLGNRRMAVELISVLP